MYLRYQEHYSQQVKTPAHINTTVLQVPVPDITAERFQALSEQQQTLAAQLVADCLTEPTSVAVVMDYINSRAIQRGLTPDILQRLLDKEWNSSLISTH